MSAKPIKQVLGGREKVKVAIAQKSPAFMNRDASVGRACAAIEEAGRNSAQLGVFPELDLLAAVLDVPGVSGSAEPGLRPTHDKPPVNHG